MYVEAIFWVQKAQTLTTPDKLAMKQKMLWHAAQGRVHVT